MGIHGLTSYITGNPEFSEPYELHGGYLVIDSMSLLYKIYAHSRCRSAFGGDHDEYARAVTEFFDDLAKCKVTPLVIFHGGREQKKNQKVEEHMKAALRTAKHYSPLSTKPFLSISLMLSYKDILLKKSIKMGYAVFEADASMAGIARALNCPVLSDESNFYVYGISYIQLHTLERYVVKKNDVYVRRCRIYRPKNLLGTFPGLDAKVLPLLAVLLCNDRTVDNVFEAFFKSLNIPHDSWERIHTTLHWLKNHNLDDAVAAILSKLPKILRRRALSMMELGVNGVFNAPCELLVSLGFEDLYRKLMSIEPCGKPFKFQGNINALESTQSWRKTTVENSSSDEETKKEVREYEKKYSNPKIEETWPQWFFRRYSKGELSCDFVGIMGSRLCTAWAHIEDFNYRSPSAMSFEILRVIDGLLVSGRTDEIPPMSFIARDGNDYSSYRFDGVLQGTRSVKFPSLEQLEDTKMDIKKRIIDDTLGIDGREHLFQDLPPKWRLYVATIFYWMKSCEEPPRNSCHLYAVLLAMLIGVIDQKIGYHRSEYSFKRSFGQKISDILSEGQLSKSENPENVSIRENSMIEALEAVTEDDCLVAAPFFISLRSTQTILIDSPEEFNVTIVHVFSQFQACFDATIQLNSLLGYPYERSNISEFYNGTMLYNLYTNFEKVPDAEAYIDETLENSPNLSNLMKLLIRKMKNILQS